METQFLATVENLIIMIDTNLGFNGEDALMGKMCETVNDCNNVIVGNCTGEQKCPFNLVLIL